MFNAVSAILTVAVTVVAVLPLPYDRHAARILLVLSIASLTGVALAWYRRRYWGPALLVTLGLTSCGAIAWQATAPSLEQLHRDGERMIVAIDDYHRLNGRYPSSLKEAGVRDVNTRFGEWKYAVKQGGYFLAIGEYERDLFTLVYDSRSRAWHDDT